MNRTENFGPSPTPRDIFEAAQARKAAEPVEKMPSSTEEIDQLIRNLENHFSDKPEVEPVEARPSQLGAAAIDLDQKKSKPQTIGAEASPGTPDAIPEDVVAAVASTMKRADFVKQQEDLFGANDDIKAEDVPEGELTYEQYLAQRPVAEEGDFYHYNKRVYSAAPAAPMKNKKEIYEAKLAHSSADEYYERVQLETIDGDEPVEELVENPEEAFVEALAKNEVMNRAYSEIIRDNTEGEVLVQKDVRLQGLLGIGEELLALHNGEVTGDDSEKNVHSALEAKKAIFYDLLVLYQDKGLDTRALGFIQDKTYSRVDDPAFIPVEGSPYLNEEKVDILDFTETDDGAQKTYTVEKEDGTVEAVDANEVTFKREFVPYEIPVLETPEVEASEQEEEATEAVEPAEEAEEKLSRFERAKKWFSKERKKIQEFGGKLYFGTLWSSSGNWLTTRHITEDMTPEDAYSQKLRNRRNAMFGLAAIVVVGAIARQYGISEMGHEGIEIPADTGGLGSNPTETMIDTTPDTGGDVPPVPEVNLDINNPVYEISDGGGGLDLFHSLGLTDEQWYENANMLQSRFPDTFYLENGDVRLMDSGWLPTEVRQVIESLKNS